MKTIEFKRFYFGDRVKWSEMFESEAELVELVQSVDVKEFINKGCQGYVYVESCQRTLNSGKDLSKAQLTQLKRIAKDIYKYHNNL